MESSTLKTTHQTSMNDSPFVSVLNLWHPCIEALIFLSSIYFRKSVTCPWKFPISNLRISTVPSNYLSFLIYTLSYEHMITFSVHQILLHHISIVHLIIYTLNFLVSYLIIYVGFLCMQGLRRIYGQEGFQKSNKICPLHLLTAFFK